MERDVTFPAGIRIVIRCNVDMDGEAVAERIEKIHEDMHQQFNTIMKIHLAVCWHWHI